MEAGSGSQRVRLGRSHGLSGAWSWFVRSLYLLCLPGGVLWALSPLGIHLSELKFKSPEMFWKLFLLAPLLLGIGLAGLYLRSPRNPGLLAKAGLWVTLGGVSLILAGDVGLFFLDLDEAYIMSAPAYRMFRAGLFLFAAGSLLFGLGALRDDTLSPLAAFPLIAGSLGGLLFSAQNLGPFGVTLWAFFGLGWAWTTLALFGETVWAWSASRRSGKKRDAHNII